MRMLTLVIIILIVSILSIWVYSQFTLKNVEKLIEKHYPVNNITVEELKEKRSSSDSSKILLFDTRSAEEYQMSHIPGAVRLDPDMKSQTIINEFGAKITNKQLIFYCSVGQRSSKIIERLLDGGVLTGSSVVANLRGGIFRWHNSGYQVVNNSGHTNKVHPYNRLWGRLLDGSQ